MTSIKHIFVLFSLSLLNACASNSWLTEASSTIKVESEPSNANIYVMGQNIGKTPLDISLNKVYPVTYSQDQLSQYGMIEIKKSRCESYSKKINSNDITKGINVNLNCHNELKVEKSISSEMPSADNNTEIQSEKSISSVKVILNTKPDTNVAPIDIITTPKLRLIQLKNLYKEGLISNEEYQAIRSRILDTL